MSVGGGQGVLVYGAGGSSSLHGCVETEGLMIFFLVKGQFFCNASSFFLRCYFWINCFAVANFLQMLAGEALLDTLQGTVNNGCD